MSGFSQSVAPNNSKLINNASTFFIDDESGDNRMSSMVSQKNQGSFNTNGEAPNADHRREGDFLFGSISAAKL
jgi:hypothetical protein